MMILHTFALLLLLLIGKSVQATDIYIKMEIFPERQEKIFREIVDDSGLAKSKKDNYHLTLAKVEIKESQETNKSEELRRYLIEKLKRSQQSSSESGYHAFVLKDIYPDCYSVNRKKNSCPIVLFPDPQSAKVLKGYNEVLDKALAEFNTKHQTSLRMCDDHIPSNYSPHITLANTKWINENCKVGRDELVNNLKINIQKAKDQKCKKLYSFKLKFPEK